MNLHRDPDPDEWHTTLRILIQLLWWEFIVDLSEDTRLTGQRDRLVRAADRRALAIKTAHEKQRR